MPLLQEIIDVVEKFAPPYYQESYDNSGLIYGNPQNNIERALISLDCTEEIIDEAIEKKCQLVLSHHPIIFSGLKSLTGKTYIERVMIKAIQNNISIYAAHTNLDHMPDGVNKKIAQKLGLSSCQILQPKTGTLRKLYVYVPIGYMEQIQTALFEAGAGSIGQYSSCSFNMEGTGTFMPLAGSNPFSGTQNILQCEKEGKIEVVYTAEKEKAILSAMKLAHPYEEIAYGIIALQNPDPYTGAGMTGLLEVEMTEEEFFGFLKEKLKVTCIRHTGFLNKKVKKIAFCGGAGSFLLPKAIQSGSDVLITADFKYHQFFDAEKKILIADIGHYESEQFTGEIFYEVLSNKFPNFAIHLTSINTNPIKYY